MKDSLDLVSLLLASILEEIKESWIVSIVRSARNRDTRPLYLMIVCF